MSAQRKSNQEDRKDTGSQVAVFQDEISYDEQDRCRRQERRRVPTWRLAIKHQSQVFRIQEQHRVYANQPRIDWKLQDTLTGLLHKSPTAVSYAKNVSKYT